MWVERNWAQDNTQKECTSPSAGTSEPWERARAQSLTLYVVLEELEPAEAEWARGRYAGAVARKV